jgi:endonuclease/exonuclease/phosphatase family metal-dependent hydrolase
MLIIDAPTQLYEARLSGTFEIFTKQRTGSKNEGLALLVHREAFDEVEVSALELEPRNCDRVALVGRMRHRASGKRILVLNTHLTVAHVNSYDIPHNRPLQMEQVLAAARDEEAVVLIGADLNCDHLEDEPPPTRSGAPAYTTADVARPVHMAFESGFRSALHTVLAAGPASPACRPISHTCSCA